MAVSELRRIFVEPQEGSSFVLQAVCVLEEPTP